MSQPILVPPGNDIEPEDADSGSRQLAVEMLPSWLVSLVTHLVLILVLAFMRVLGDGISDDGVVLDCAIASAGGAADGGALDALMASPSEIAESELTSQTATHLPANLPQQLEETLKINLVGLAPDGSLTAGELSSAGSGAGVGPEDDDGTPGLGPVRTQVFGLSGEGTRFVYVFDRSQSMSSTFSYSSEGTTVFSITPLDAAKAELLRSLGDLDQRHRFQIVFYNHEPWVFDVGRPFKRMIVASRENKRRAAAFVGSVYAIGNTNHMRPLELALRLRPDVIFLLTDGEGKDDPTTYQLRELERLNSGRTKINVINFCFAPRPNSTLVQLANENGGKHVFVNISGLGPGLAGVGP